MPIKYTVTKQLDGGTNVVFEGEVFSVEEALADVARLNAEEVIQDYPTVTNVDDTTSTKPRCEVKVGDRIEIVDPFDDRYWKGSTAVVKEVLEPTSNIFVKFDKGSYNPNLTDGDGIVVCDYEYKVIS